MHTLTLPWSKSITNRDLILATLTEEEVILSWILESDDTHFMIEVLRKIGIKIEKSWNTLIIQWGREKLHGSDTPLFLWASWTCMRFLSALCALNREGSITLTGKERLLERPMKPLIQALRDLWITVESNGDFPPLTITGISTTPPKEISFFQQKKNNYCHSVPTSGSESFRNKNCKEQTNYEYNKEKIISDWEKEISLEKIEITKKIQKISLDGSSSSQYFTALLHIAPLLPNGLHIIVENKLVSKPYIDITIYEMKKFWVSVENNDYKEFFVAPQKYQVSKNFLWWKNSKVSRIFVEWDASALSYIANFIVLHGGEIEINNLGNTTKQGDYKYLDMLKIFWLEYSSNGKKTILKATWIRHQDLSPYKNMSFDFEDMPDVSLSFMSLCLFLWGTNHITGLKTLNLKECLRINAMHQELEKLWVKISSDNESISIGELASWQEKEEKNFQKQEFQSFSEFPISIDTYDDHRIAMTFGVLGTYIWNLNIVDKSCVAKTYPRFWKDLAWMEKNIWKT